MRNIGNFSSHTIENIWLVAGLKHNLLSICQLCKIGYEVMFDKNNFTIVILTDKFIFFIENRKGNVYQINFSDLANQKVV